MADECEEGEQTSLVPSPADPGEWRVSLSSASETLWSAPATDPKGSLDFIRGIRLSPDGSHCLAYTERTIFCQPLLDRCNSMNSATQDVLTPLALLPQHPRGDAIYDLIWWPGMTLEASSSCCFLTSRRDHPIHLIDACSGALRASYRMYNQVDEIESASALAFNLYGNKIYAGCNRMIRVFDLNEPGARYTSIPTSKTRHSALGQKGLISCLAFNPDCSGAYAAGSFASSVGIYVENESGTCSVIVYSPSCLSYLRYIEAALELSNLDFGVTALKWSPCGR